MQIEFDDGETLFWPPCAATGCEYGICLGASNVYCYIHTLEFLLMSQIEAMNRIGIDLPDYANQWIPRDASWIGDKERMEAMLMQLADMEMNYLDKWWLDSAREIIRRIELPE